MVRPRIISLALGIAIAFTAGCAAQRGFPAHYSIANYDEVDRAVSRGGQPGRFGLEQLSRTHMGCLVIDLRDDPWMEEAKICRELGMEYVNVPLSGTRAPTKAEVEMVLRLIRQHRGAVFVHCEHGCDRTGTIVACYKLRFYRFPRQITNKEALNDAFFHGLSHWELGMIRFIKRFK